MESYFSQTISVGDFITHFKNEMKKLNYCPETIHNRVLMIKRAFSGNTRLFDEKVIFSFERLFDWINMQKAKLDACELSHNRYLLMQNTVDLCRELFQTGKLERKGRHRKYEKYIPECYKKLQEDFLQCLSSRMSYRTNK